MWRDAQLDGVRVLVIDDNGDARELVQLILSAAGAIACTVGSVPEAVDALEHGRWDVAICDICMPGDSGFDLLRRLQFTGNTTPVIAHTALGWGEEHRLRNRGFAAVVPKPFDPDQLIPAVLDVLRISDRPLSAPRAPEPFASGSDVTAGAH